MRYRCFIAVPGLAVLIVSAAAWGQADRSAPVRTPPDRSAAPDRAAAQRSEPVTPQPVRQTFSLPTTQSAAHLADAPATEPIEGYDFEHIVDHWQKSMTPFRHEMDRKSKDFIKALDTASALLDEGKEREAIGEVVAAIERVLVVRDRVMKPMWAGQQYFDEQIDRLRHRLARMTPEGAPNIDARTEQLLNVVAKEIRDEPDAVRRRRMTIRYKALRALAEVNAMKNRLTPDQRALWLNVLNVLEDTATVHLQMVVRAEVMFAQFEQAAAGLRNQHVWYDTARGAVELVKHVNEVRTMHAYVADMSTATANSRAEMTGSVRKLVDRLESELATAEGETAAELAKGLPAHLR